MIGKQIRLERIMNRNTGRIVFVPLDHGVTVGPIPGIIDLKSTIAKVSDGGANAIVIHKGNVRSGHRGQGKDIGLIIHISGSTSLSPDPNSKVLICTVEEVLQLGADAISIQVNLGSEDEKDMLKDFGKISRQCMQWGVPLLAMVYTRGKKVKNENDVQVVKHAARLAAELGADIVKVSYTGSADSFQEVVEGCGIPVVIAGGEKADNDRDVLISIKDAISVGCAGVAIGRNVFQHKNPTAMTKAIASIVHENKTVEQALLLIN
jgi:predicted phospho-2-dehydro-3-deoxyheptonate aldolase